MFDEQIQHAQFDLPKPPRDLPATHPLRNPKTHERLLEYCRQRLQAGMGGRDTRVARYAQIDRDVYAWMQLDEQDRIRQSKHEKDGSPLATKMSLPLTWVHIDDMMTYYAQTFAPNRGMFYHTANPQTGTEEASQLVTIMNNHSVYGSYYRHLLRAIFNLLKYNVGGVMANWATDYGPKIAVRPDESVGVESQAIFSGNKIKAIDMYNFMYDESVEPSQLHCDGEWFAIAEMKSHYWLKQKCLDGVYFNCEDLLEGSGSMGKNQYYKDPPVESRMDSEGTITSGGRVNWYAWMAGGASTYTLNNGFELVTVYIRINPNDFGLVPGNKQARDSRNKYEIWRITIANDEKVIECQQMNNIHNYLPAFLGVLNDDFLRDAAKSSAEILNPLQQFSSFLLNTHVEGNRKNLYGTTFYDPSRVDYASIPAGEVAARVPVKPEGYGQDIRTMVYHDNHNLDTKQTLEDLQGMMEIINMFFPTQSLPSQIAGIDRAVDSQVAAVQQGSNRRQHKGARLIDDTMMRPMRYALYYNIVQYQADGVDIADYFKGTTTKVDLTKLRDTSLVTLIGQGLKSLDRQQVASQMQQIIFALIQAPQTAQGINLLDMLDYWTSMMDIDTNMKQFALPPAQPQVAPGIPADGAAAPIMPANDPQNLTSPLYG